MHELPPDINTLQTLMSNCYMRYLVRINKNVNGRIELNALSNNMPNFQLEEFIRDYNIIGYQKIFNNIFLFGKEI